VFDAFYWIINVGSFAASLSMPWLLDQLGSRRWCSTAGAIAT